VVKNSRINEGLGSGIKEFKNAAKDRSTSCKRGRNKIKKGFS
jgi:hypothetical protein